MVQVTQILSQRYVDKTKLIELCRSEFGNDNFGIEDDDGNFVLTMPRTLTEEEIGKIKPDKSSS